MDLDPERVEGAELYVLGRHAWGLVQRDGTALLGMGETFAALEDPVADAEYPGLGDDVVQGNRCIRMVDEKQCVYRLWAPLSGRVVEVNERALPQTASADWTTACRRSLLRIVPSNLEGELVNLNRRGSPAKA